MKIFNKVILTGIAILLLTTYPKVYAQQTNFDEKFNKLNEIYKSFDKEQLNLLKNNETIIILKNDSFRKYPDVYVFSLIEASPEEVTAVFTDYERHKDFFDSGKLKKSYIATEITKTNVYVNYELEVAKLPFYTIIESYTLEYNLSTFMDGKAYKVYRDLKYPGEHLCALEGVARIEPLKGKTLIANYGYLDPGINISQEDVIRNVSYVVEQLKRRIAYELENDRDLLMQQITILRNRLN